jgi:hypothetical protein
VGITLGTYKKRINKELYKILSNINKYCIDTNDIIQGTTKYNQMEKNLYKLHGKHMIQKFGTIVGTIC